MGEWEWEQQPLDNNITTVNSSNGKKKKKSKRNSRKSDQSSENRSNQSFGRTKPSTGTSDEWGEASATVKENQPTSNRSNHYQTSRSQSSWSGGGMQYKLRQDQPRTFHNQDSQNAYTSMRPARYLNAFEPVPGKEYAVKIIGKDPADLACRLADGQERFCELDRCLQQRFRPFDDVPLVRKDDMKHNKPLVLLTGPRNEKRYRCFITENETSDGQEWEVYLVDEGRFAAARPRTVSFLPIKYARENGVAFPAFVPNMKSPFGKEIDPNEVYLVTVGLKDINKRRFPITSLLRKKDRSAISLQEMLIELDFETLAENGVEANAKPPLISADQLLSPTKVDLPITLNCGSIIDLDTKSMDPSENGKESDEESFDGAPNPYNTILSIINRLTIVVAKLAANGNTVKEISSEELDSNAEVLKEIEESVSAIEIQIK